ncbi:MAG: hypothetical protein WA446_05010 [Steroidobacteraceae bacterium]
MAGKRPWPLQIEFVFRASAAKLEILVDFDDLRLSGVGALLGCAPCPGVG